jgi:ornithine decarboxylase
MFSNAKFVFSRSKIIEEYNKISEISDLLAYSVKTNPYIVSTLEEKKECRFLIHHINEIKYIKNKENILYMLHSPEKEELDLIFQNNISFFIVDNKKDLEYFLEYLKKNNKKVNLLLRMRLKEYTVNTGKYFVYGMYSNQINELILKLKENKNIEKIGVHFHRKTQNLSEWNLVKELEETLSYETFEIIDYMDIGGGIPIDYKNIKAETILDVYNKIKKLKEFLNKKNIKMIIEPGRAIAGPSGKLICNIKNIIDNTIFIDASVFNSQMDIIVSNIKLLVKGEKDSGSYYVIKGLTPASEDIFRYRVYLENPKIGDQIIFLNAGAYIYHTDLFSLDKLKVEFVD